MYPENVVECGKGIRLKNAFEKRKVRTYFLFRYLLEAYCGYWH